MTEHNRLPHVGRVEGAIDDLKVRTAQAHERWDKIVKERGIKPE